MINSFFLVLSFLTTIANATPCNDGWESPSTGRGTCSHHGGIDRGSTRYYPATSPQVIQAPEYPGIQVVESALAQLVAARLQLEASRAQLEEAQTKLERERLAR